MAGLKREPPSVARVKVRVAFGAHASFHSDRDVNAPLAYLEAALRVVGMRICMSGGLLDSARMTVLDWLLDSDPAIRWQVSRDLVHASAEVVAAERARVATEGWGARLLALQGEDGQWAGGACFPGRSFYQPDQERGQPWTSTLPTLQLLRDFGVDPRREQD